MAAVRRGCFILFEGCDRCGKTTQAKKLAEYFVSSGQQAEFMRFPDRETVGIVGFTFGKISLVLAV